MFVCGQLGMATGATSSSVEVAIAQQRLGAIYLELKKELDGIRRSGPHKISKAAMDQVQQFIQLAEDQIAPHGSEQLDTEESADDGLTVCPAYLVTALFLCQTMITYLNTHIVEKTFNMWVTIPTLSYNLLKEVIQLVGFKALFQCELSSPTQSFFTAISCRLPASGHTTCSRNC